MTDRRRQDLVRKGDRITDEAVMRDYLASVTPTRVRVARLSTTDPEISAFEATARGPRAWQVAS